jgi:hypothetical protein
MFFDVLLLQYKNVLIMCAFKTKRIQFKFKNDESVLSWICSRRRAQSSSQQLSQIVVSIYPRSAFSHFSSCCVCRYLPQRQILRAFLVSWSWRLTSPQTMATICICNVQLCVRRWWWYSMSVDWIHESILDLSTIEFEILLHKNNINSCFSLQP